MVDTRIQGRGHGLPTGDGRSRQRTHPRTPRTLKCGGRRAMAGQEGAQGRSVQAAAAVESSGAGAGDAPGTRRPPRQRASPENAENGAVSAGMRAMGGELELELEPRLPTQRAPMFVFCTFNMPPSPSARWEPSRTDRLLSLKAFVRGEIESVKLRVATARPTPHSSDACIRHSPRVLARCLAACVLSDRNPQEAGRAALDHVSHVAEHDRGRWDGWRQGPVFTCAKP
jgi:hypothetical protein